MKLISDKSLDFIMAIKEFRQIEETRIIPLREIIDDLIKSGFQEFVLKKPELNDLGMGNAEARH
jgi:hypothetical protein